MSYEVDLTMSLLGYQVRQPVCILLCISVLLDIKLSELVSILEPCVAKRSYHIAQCSTTNVLHLLLQWKKLLQTQKIYNQIYFPANISKVISQLKYCTNSLQQMYKQVYDNILVHISYQSSLICYQLAKSLFFLSANHWRLQ